MNKVSLRSTRSTWLACKGLEGKKVDNIKPQRIVSSSPLVMV